MPTAPRRRLLVSAAANWFAFAASIVTAFFLAPYLIGVLGPAAYGVWGYVESILMMFTLLDLGVGACLVRYVARFEAQGDRDGLNRMASAALAVFAAGGSVIVVGGLILWPTAGPAAVEKSGGAAGVVPFMLVMLANLACTLPLTVFPAVLEGLGMYALRSGVRVTFLLLRVGGMVWVCRASPGLLPLGLVYAGCNLAEHGALAVLAFRHSPGLRFSRRLIDRQTLRTVAGYSGSAFLAMVAGRLSQQSAPLVIGRMSPTYAPVTFFVLAWRLVDYARSLLRSATATLTPALSSLDAAGDTEAVRRVLLRATRWVLYAVLPIQIGLVMFGRPFFAIWVGPEYAAVCYPVLVVLSSTLSLVVAQSVASRVLYGVGRLKWFARLALVEAGVSVTLSLLLIGRFGVAGVAFAVVAPNAVFCLWVIAEACRYAGQPVGAYLREAWLRPLTLAAVPVPVWLTLSRSVTIDGWFSLGGVIVAGLACYGSVVTLIEFGEKLRAAIRLPSGRRDRVLTTSTRHNVA